MAAAIALTVMAALLGVLVIVLGLVRTDDNAAGRPPSRLKGRFNSWRGQFTRRRQLIALAGLAGGVLLWFATGWFIALIAVPAAAIGIPLLLGRGSEPANIERLEAIEQWTRSLSGLIIAGAGLEQAIIVSLSSTPAPLQESVSRLVARINARWATHDALQAFADDLADPTGDLVVAHLKLASTERGPGLATALEDLAGDVFDEVKARRQIEADRAKPRQNVRLITFITLGVLALVPFAGQFFAPYGTPLGQMLLAVWLVIYVAVLVWIKSYTNTRPTPRILINAREAGS